MGAESRVEARDELPHDFQAGDNWIENWWLTFADLERDIQGVVYGSFHSDRPGFSRLFLIDDGTKLAESEARGRFPLAIDGTAVHLHRSTFDCREPFARWRYASTADGAEMDLDWEAIFPPYNWDWMALTNSQHVEQTGRVKGTIVVNGQRLAVDGFGQRDRAWGVRRPSDFRRAWSSRGFGSDGSVLHASIIETQTRRLLFGYYGTPDGEVEPLRALSLDIRHDEADGSPRATLLRCTTSADRELEYGVSLRYVYPVRSSGKVEACMYFTLARWDSERGGMLGQLDYWWRGAPAADGELSASGNDGTVERALWSPPS